jgi:hypothetical protein
MLLERGDSLQQASVLSSLRHLLKAEGGSKLVQACLDRSSKLDDDLQLELAHGLLDALPLVPGECLRPVLETAAVVLEQNSEVLCEDWGRLLEAVCRTAQVTEVRDVCVPLALHLCSSSRPTFMRRVGVLLIGLLAELLGRFFPDSLLEQVVTQSQNASYDIRKTMCRVIGKVSEELGATEQLFPSLEQLLQDDDGRVREEAASTFFRVLPLLSEQTVLGKGLSILQQLIQGPAKLQIVKHMNSLLPALMALPGAAYMSEIMLNVYLEALSAGNKVEALKVFPEVARCVEPMIFEGKLVYAYLNLASDPDVEVRRAVASTFHQVVLLMSNSPTSAAKLLTLLDHDSDVAYELLSHIDAWSPTLLNENIFLQARYLLLSRKSWRVKQELLEHITPLVVMEHSSLISESLSSTLLKLMKEENATVRESSAKIVVQLLSVLYQSNVREELAAQLVEFCTSTVYRDRITFIDVCLLVISMCSQRFFKQFFLSPLLSLGSDRILAVKLKFAGSLSHLRFGIDSEDSASLEELYNAVTTLANDKEALVAQLATDQQILMSSPAFMQKSRDEKLQMEEARRIEREKDLQSYELASREEAKQRIVSAMSAKVRRDTKKKLSVQLTSSKRSSPRRPTGGKVIRGSYSFSEGRTETPPKRTDKRK